MQTRKFDRDRKKYIFLTNVGARQLGNQKSFSLWEEDGFHDLKLTQTVRQLLASEVFIEAKLDHELEAGSFVPDAELKINHKGRILTMPLELELTRKSKDRIWDKVEFYLNSSIHDVILYMFSNQNLMKSYFEILETRFGKTFNNKIILMAHEQLMAESFNLSDAFGYYKGNSVKLGHIFPFKKVEKNLEKLEKFKKITPANPS
ncbi:MAG: hypothetical protein ACOYL6_17415 [Bacteriovoracaceae bacterium]